MFQSLACQGVSYVQTHHWINNKFNWFIELREVSLAVAGMVLLGFIFLVTTELNRKIRAWYNASLVRFYFS